MKKPVPDGVMTVHTYHGAPRGYNYNTIVFMRKEHNVFRIVFTDEHGRRHVVEYPWTSILHLDNKINSDDYIQKYEAWVEYEKAQAIIENRIPSYREEHIQCFGCATKTMKVVTDNVRGDL
jgi:hypothetical protein